MKSKWKAVTVAGLALTFTGPAALAAPDGGSYETAILGLNPIAYSEHDEPADQFSGEFPKPVDTIGITGKIGPAGSSCCNYNDQTDLAPALAGEENFSIFIRQATDLSGLSPDGGDMTGIPGQKYFSFAKYDRGVPNPLLPDSSASFSAVMFIQQVQTGTQQAQNPVFLGQHSEAGGAGNGTNDFTGLQEPGPGIPSKGWALYAKDTDVAHHGYDDPNLDPPLAGGGDGGPDGTYCSGDSRCDTGSDLTFEFTDGQNNLVQWTTGVDVLDGNPYMLGVSYDGNTQDANIFVNGVDVPTTQTTVVGDISNITYDVAIDGAGSGKGRMPIGNFYGGNNLFHGLIDEVAYFAGQDSLTAADHAELWRVSQIPEPASLVLLAMGGLALLGRRHG